MNAEKIKNCICGNKTYHSRECRRRQTLNKSNERRRRERAKLREQHRCIWCKNKVKPIITYPQFCEEHNDKNRRERKNKK